MSTELDLGSVLDNSSSMLGCSTSAKSIQAPNITSCNQCQGTKTNHSLGHQDPENPPAGPGSVAMRSKSPKEYSKPHLELSLELVTCPGVYTLLHN